MKNTAKLDQRGYAAALNVAKMLKVSPTATFGICNAYVNNILQEPYTEDLRQLQDILLYRVRNLVGGEDTTGNFVQPPTKLDEYAYAIDLLKKALNVYETELKKGAKR